MWSDSDECSSDVEAAVRPRPFNTNTDDLDDFCDWYILDIFFLIDCILSLEDIKQFAL